MQNLGHIGGSMSIADVLSVIMQDFDIKKDEIIFSKGHASPALYSALYLNKIITKEEIDGFRKIDGTLEGHPSIHTKGIKVATGSLGQGLSVGIRNGTSVRNFLKKKEKFML
jgi:probable transketolase